MHHSAARQLRRLQLQGVAGSGQATTRRIELQLLSDQPVTQRKQRAERVERLAGRHARCDITHRTIACTCDIEIGQTLTCLIEQAACSPALAVRTLGVFDRLQLFLGRRERLGDHLRGRRRRR